MNKYILDLLTTNIYYNKINKISKYIFLEVNIIKFLGLFFIHSFI